MQTLLPLAEQVAILLRARRETIVVAESSAGGLIAAALLAVPGASAYFLGDGAGHSCIAIAGMAEEVITLETGATDRVANMRAFSAAALQLLLRHLAH